MVEDGCQRRDGCRRRDGCQKRRCMLFDRRMDVKEGDVCHLVEEMDVKRRMDVKEKIDVKRVMDIKREMDVKGRMDVFWWSMSYYMSSYLGMHQASGCRR